MMRDKNDSDPGYLVPGTPALFPHHRSYAVERVPDPSHPPPARTKGQTMIRKKAKIALTTVYDARKVHLEVGFPFMSEPEICGTMGSHHHSRRAELPNVKQPCLRSKSYRDHLPDSMEPAIRHSLLVTLSFLYPAFCILYSFQELSHDPFIPSSRHFVTP